ncbi:hypothetical protein Tsubulata_014695 [Turnera subulata]|uniref:F-box/LRR-repeat protein 15/At3g58940/PEG3-like LRR domain-containing protein n=1 Tax=Turnera subulata TaxID=218843 RepID=A0A9Q0FLZ2_9ROSI|nr:hypothetical protein Tsubulata_014695 [Turnera subulata]
MRWSYLWTSVPCLSFSYKGREPNKRWFEFVDTTLFYHNQSSLKKFSADLDYHYMNDPSIINSWAITSSFPYWNHVSRWLRLASLARVEELTLILGDATSSSRPQLPQHVYTNSSLAALRLSRLLLRPETAVTWGSIKLLSVRATTWTDDSISKIIAGCPSLEHLELQLLSGTISRLDFSGSRKLKKLVIRDCDTYQEKIEVLAPYLESLEISGMVGLRPITLRVLDAKSLVDCYLDYMPRTFCITKMNPGYNLVKHYQQMLRPLLQDIRHVNQASLGTWCIEQWRIRGCLLRTLNAPV